MKEFKSKGISLEGIVGENPAKEKKKRQERHITKALQ